jgi:hypothetical protein
LPNQPNVLRVIIGNTDEHTSDWQQRHEHHHSHPHTHNEGEDHSHSHNRTLPLNIKNNPLTTNRSLHVNKKA